MQESSSGPGMDAAAQLGWTTSEPVDIGTDDHENFPPPQLTTQNLAAHELNAGEPTIPTQQEQGAQQSRPLPDGGRKEVKISAMQELRYHKKHQFDEPPMREAVPPPKKSIWNKELGQNEAVIEVKPAMPAWRLAAMRIKTKPKAKAKPWSETRGKWNPSHQYVVMNNDTLPKGQRSYFSRSPPLEEVIESLKKQKKKRPATTSLIRAYSEPEVRPGSRGHPLTSSLLSADADLGVLHETRSSSSALFGGSMVDRDGDLRGWNNRHQYTASASSHIMAPAHRHYFTGNSIYDDEVAMNGSQVWRRGQSYAIAPGQWRPIGTKKANPLGPIGCHPGEPHQIV